MVGSWCSGCVWLMFWMGVAGSLDVFGWCSRCGWLVAGVLDVCGWCSGYV